MKRKRWLLRPMSLIVAIKVTAGDIVLVGDRRATMGDPRALVGLDEQVTKLYDYAPGVALGIVGTPGVVVPAVRHAKSAFAAAVAAAAAAAGAGGPVPDALATLRDALRDHYLSNFGVRPFITDKQIIDGRPNATILYADRQAQRLSILTSEVNFTVLDDGRPYLMAGVTPYANYLYQRLSRADFTTAEAVRLGLFLVTETSRLDPKVGSECDVLILEAAHTVTLTASQIGRIVEENRTRFATFAASFKDPVPPSVPPSGQPPQPPATPTPP
jgi:hypothetical protein